MSTVFAVLGVIGLLSVCFTAFLVTVALLMSRPAVAGAVDTVLAFPVDPVGSFDEEDLLAMELVLELESCWALPVLVPAHERKGQS